MWKQRLDRHRFNHIGGRVLAAAVVLDMGKSLIEKQALIAFALAAMFATRAAKLNRLIVKGAKNIRYNKYLEKKQHHVTPSRSAW